MRDICPGSKTFSSFSICFLLSLRLSKFIYKTCAIWFLIQSGGYALPPDIRLFTVVMFELFFLFTSTIKGSVR